MVYELTLEFKLLCSIIDVQILITTFIELLSLEINRRAVRPFILLLRESLALLPSVTESKRSSKIIYLLRSFLSLSRSEQDFKLIIKVF